MGCVAPGGEKNLCKLQMKLLFIIDLHGTEFIKADRYMHPELSAWILSDWQKKLGSSK